MQAPKAPSSRRTFPRTSVPSYHIPSAKGEGKSYPTRRVHPPNTSVRRNRHACPPLTGDVSSHLPHHAAKGAKALHCSRQTAALSRSSFACPAFHRAGSGRKYQEAGLAAPLQSGGPPFLLSLLSKCASGKGDCAARPPSHWKKVTALPEQSHTLPDFPLHRTERDRADLPQNRP